LAVGVIGGDTGDIRRVICPVIRPVIRRAG
jgi:hypothetical protein